MDKYRLLSSLWYRFYYMTGRGKHWRNEQNFGLSKQSNKNDAESDEVRSLINSNKPFFIGRYGTIELHLFLKGFRLKYMHDHNCLSIVKSIFLSQPECWALGGGNVGFQTNAGVFPLTEQCLDNFTDIYFNATKDLDVLASWQKAEEWLFKYHIIQTKQKIDYNILEFAFRLRHPWTSALKDKKVLVISPFAKQIESQYNSNKRHHLFTNKEFLPDFELKTITSVNTAGRHPEESGFKAWKDALTYMKHQIDNVDFDIALLGCGAYAFPLGAYIKRKGKQAITVCGALQTYFGVYGGRTESLKERNEYWVRPEKATRPKGFEQIENSAYW